MKSAKEVILISSLEELLFDSVEVGLSAEFEGDVLRLLSSVD